MLNLWDMSEVRIIVFEIFFFNLSEIDTTMRQEINEILWKKY